MINYYKILGVTATSSQAEIKKAYKVLAIQYHPDKNNGSKASEEQFKKISEAYIVLSDTAKRNAYDYSKKQYKQENRKTTSDEESALVTFLLLFRKIKNRVLNANGHIDEAALFKVINDLLSNKNIDLLIDEDIVAKSLMIDDILVCCIFINNTLKLELHPKLLKLANGDPKLVERISILTTKKEEPANEEPDEDDDLDEAPSIIFMILFIMIVIAILFMVL
ncbi:MAG: hypothetical protein BM557_07065 [Flavobacterium sp. MedPE-SWcel]|uniref:DnaJ domain-containing protein n=1 Tax=uncultured Flavobacterium sp. TaxID=165435 RepID=UPI00091813C3|nr:DnaJ domain-containing protein [uncultured Flavobacterium sp.]OIQ18674.1 MAG: hypothetical protein BM557_07065 [Flavobacterium sp. MedPE-SWcel]